jgi:ATP-dependent Clp protease ATP-binding subunit ClpA
LLDEIEKAHPDVFNMLLQVMDYGKLTDSNGRTSDFRHAILIMTSNVGARELEQSQIGFLANTKSDDQALKRLFSPEFRNRLDARVVFNKLSEDVVIKVVEKFIGELSAMLFDKKIQIHISDKAKEYLAKAGYDPTMGARPLNRLIEEQIKKPLAQEILFGKLSAGGTAKIDMVDDKISLEYKEAKG